MSSRNALSFWGVHQPKVGLSAKFGVVVIQGIYSQFTGGSISQSRFVCQLWCSSIQGIYSQFTGGSIGQSRFVHQLWCSSYSRHLFSIHWWGPLTNVGSSANLGGLVFKACLLYYLGGPSAKVCSSAKFYVLVFKASLLDYGGTHLPKYVHLPSCVCRYSRHLCSIHCGGVHWPKKLCPTNMNTLLNYF